LLPVGSGRGGPRHDRHQLLLMLAQGGREAVLLVAEVLIERPARHPGSHRDVLDGERAIPLCADRFRHRSDQPLSLMLDARSAVRTLAATGKLTVTALDELASHGSTLQIEPGCINTDWRVFVEIQHALYTLMCTGLYRLHRSGLVTSASGGESGAAFWPE